MISRFLSAIVLATAGLLTAVATNPAFAAGTGKVGVFRSGTWYLELGGNDRWDGAPPDGMSAFGLPNDIPIAGDWSGDGRTKIGVFRDGFFILDLNGNGVWDGPATDLAFAFGLPGDVPVVGDWNGDGTTKVGVFRDGFFFLDYNGNGLWEGHVTDRGYAFGMAGDIPVAGDWNGTGMAKVGVFRDGFFFLDYSGNGIWEGHLVDRGFAFGMAGDVPVIGDWNGDGFSKIGVFRNGFFFLDVDGNGIWSEPAGDRYFAFGTATDTPVAGRGWTWLVPPVAVPRAVTLNSSLLSPWGLAFLPDGRMLVTQKGGSMAILTADGASVQATVAGLPPVAASGQGGLLDVALAPDFATDPWVYWTYSEPGVGAEAGLAGTAVARGRLAGATLQDVAVIYRQVPKVGGAGHFGSRLAFRGDGTLFVTLGERQQGSPAQDLSTTLGKVIRINRDGTIPAGNPVIPGARPEIWSYGHRNPQGAAINPATGELWINEHGPQGGDELNRVPGGGNYGWPLVSYGCNYGDPVGDACRIGGGTHAPSYVEPATYWVPTSIAPAGLVFYTGSGFPQWQGQAFMGALAGMALWRVELSGNRVIWRERMFAELGERIRSVTQGTDGWLYLLTDGGKLIRIQG